jgi:redox-regulated HSP33 family molecular chaperone
MHPTTTAIRTILGITLVAASLPGASTSLGAERAVTSRSSAAGTSATAVVVPQASDADQRALVRSQNQLRAIERTISRQTRGGGVEGWFVIAFHDTTRRFTPPQAVGGGYWRTYATLDGAQATHYVLVEGRAAAAQVVYDFSQQS